MIQGENMKLLLVSFSHVELCLACLKREYIVGVVSAANFFNKYLADKYQIDNQMVYSYVFLQECIRTVTFDYVCVCDTEPDVIVDFVCIWGAHKSNYKFV